MPVPHGSLTGGIGGEQDPAGRVMTGTIGLPGPSALGGWATQGALGGSGQADGHAGGD